MKACSIAGCGKPHFGRGWCSAHYQRWQSSGSPVGGGTSPGEPMRYLERSVLTYEGDDCLRWPYRSNSHGYGLITIDKKTRVVSRIVCEIIYGPPPDPAMDASHSCGRGHLRCVNKRHLSWKSKRDNQADRLIHGTALLGARNPAAKLSEEDVRQIRALRGIVPQKELAHNFGVWQSHISAIQLGKKWALPT